MADKEELTTKMHAEFIGCELSELDLNVMGVIGATRRGILLENALKEYGLTEEEFKANVKRVLTK